MVIAENALLLFGDMLTGTVCAIAPDLASRGEKTIRDWHLEQLFPKILVSLIENRASIF
jgi:hypothetical protein